MRQFRNQDYEDRVTCYKDVMAAVLAFTASIFSPPAYNGVSLLLPSCLTPWSRPKRVLYQQIVEGRNTNRLALVSFVGWCVFQDLAEDLDPQALVPIISDESALREGAHRFAGAGLGGPESRRTAAQALWDVLSDTPLQDGLGSDDFDWLREAMAAPTHAA